MFLQTVVRQATRSLRANSSFQWRKFGSTSFKVVQNPVRLNSAKLGLAIGATSALILHTHSKILNEVTNAVSIPPIEIHRKKKPIHHSRFGGKLHYKQLSYGSLSGLFLGVVIGKLSGVFAFVALSIYLCFQFLESRGIIKIHWNNFIDLGPDAINFEELFFEDPSFKISFVLTFIIAAFNI